MNETSDAIEILNKTFGNDPERRAAIDAEKAFLLTELLDEWYNEWDEPSADCRQELDDDIDPFVIG